MWKRYDLETIFSSNDVMNIQDTTGKGFGSRERAYFMGVNDNVCPKITSIPNVSYS